MVLTSPTSWHVYRYTPYRLIFSSGHSGFQVNPQQEAIIKMYAERVGEKIGRLVAEIIVDSLTLRWAEKPIASQSTVREQPSNESLLKAAEGAN